MEEKKTQPKIFIVILNYNGKETLPECLACVFQSTYPNFEVVVVDNASQDGSFELAKENFSRAHFIKNTANLGFSKGNNIGIRFALEKFADFVFLLNNDASLEKNALSELVNNLQSSQQTALINPLILEGNKKTIWFAGGTINWLKARTLHQATVPTTKSYSTAYCTGCAMLIPKEIFKEIGLFDERYFLYYEDADFSLRAQQAGFPLLVCSSAKVYHKEQSNTQNPLKTYWLVLSGMLFFQTHGNFLQKIYFSCYFSLRNFKNSFRVFTKENPQTLQVKQAYQDFDKIKAS
ncbi:MAG: glycosyltransferase family 2 protein [Candidatus Moraniibacteriota bacterium]